MEGGPPAIGGGREKGMTTMKALLGRKLKMTRIYDDAGRAVPVTVIQAGPCGVVQVKTDAKDGYSAVQLGFHEATKRKGTTKPLAGHFKKWNSRPWKYLREVRMESAEPFTAGAVVTAGVFSTGDVVKVTGISKGKGFQGGVKRHGWHGGDMSHGSMTHRRPGSIGASSWPSRVAKGHRLPGHMGAQRTTVRNLEVVKVDAENHVVYVRGAVPGASGGLLVIQKTGERGKAKG